MYNLNDLFVMVQFHLNYILKCMPYILAHFVILFLLRNILLRSFSTRQRGAGFSAFVATDLYYPFCLILLMLLLSWMVMAGMYLYLNLGFYLGGDFVFLAGVLLGWRMGWPVLLVQVLLMAAWFFQIGRSGLLITYVMFDSVIYFAVGLFSGSQFDVEEGDYDTSDILLVCVNKLIAALMSTVCWIMLMRDSWISGINILIHRLVGWPFASLPMIFLVLFLMKQDARQRDLRTARKAENPA
ncbi:hypothetical protein [Aquitalea sp.]|uniref:hypothetical protein n=1 Tax=Aquitalea sp. TaxID=1872623 RepID=UPI0025864786|nr:hypothetical protein [Aquitalea sp.]